MSRRPHCVSPNKTSKRFIGTTVILCEKLIVVLGVIVDDLVSGNANVKCAYIPEMPTQKHVRETIYDTFSTP